jgi:hypothetical protein
MELDSSSGACYEKGSRNGKTCDMLDSSFGACNTNDSPVFPFIEIQEHALELMCIYLHSSSPRTAPKASRRHFGNCDTKSCHEMLKICNHTRILPSPVVLLLLFCPRYSCGRGGMMEWWNVWNAACMLSVTSECKELRRLNKGLVPFPW